MSDPFYITTAISYPNGPPHIGHAYEAIAADTIARFQRAAGRDVRFQTGTDEHGLKMAQEARSQEIEPRALADKMSRLFQAMCDTLDVSYDRFIRTSDEPIIIAPARRSGRRCRSAATCISAATRVGIRSATRPITRRASWSRGKGGQSSRRTAPQSNGRSRKAGSSGCRPISSRCSPLCGQSRIHSARKPPQRGGPLRRGRLLGPQHLADQLRLGRAGAGERQTT